MTALTWPDLSPEQKCRAVFRHLVDGRTPAEAAEALSVTYGVIGTNHVRGIMDRFRLHEDPQVQDARRERQRVRTSDARARAREGARNVPPVRRLPTVPAPELARACHAEKGAGQGVSLFQLTARMCRMPLGARNERAVFFCGRPALEGQSWCADCRKTVYQPAPEGGAA